MTTRYQIACVTSLLVASKQVPMNMNDHVKKNDMVNANALRSTTRLLEVEEIRSLDRLFLRNDTADLMLLLSPYSQD